MSSPPAPDDAALAVAAASGDRGALGEIYRRYAPAIWRLCQSMLHHPGDAEDCLQDVFVIAATRLGGLREPGMLRSWLFAVARHECLARIDRRGKEVPVDTVMEERAPESQGPPAALLRSERAALVRDSVAGLTARDQMVLELADGQGLSGNEFAAALGVPRSTAYTLLARARATARDAVGALLVARTGRRDCSGLDALLRGWNGTLNTLDRKRINRHIAQCEICTEQRHRVASPAALLGTGVALTAALSARVLGAAQRMQPTGYELPYAAGAAPAVAANAHDGWRDGWPPADKRLAARPKPAVRRRLGARATLLAAAMVLLGIAGGAAGGYAIWHRPHAVAVEADLVTAEHAAASTALARAQSSVPGPVIVAPERTAESTPVRSTEPPPAPATTTTTVVERSTATVTVPVTVPRTVTVTPAPPPPVTVVVTSAQTAPSTGTVIDSTPATGTATPPTTHVLTVVSNYPTRINVDQSSTECESGTTCTVRVPDGTWVAIKNDGGSISGPQCSVRSGGNGLCTFVMSGDEVVTSGP